MGELFRLPVQGMPTCASGPPASDLGRDSARGDPQALTDKQQKLLRRVRRTENSEVMPESKGFFDKIRDYLG